MPLINKVRQQFQHFLGPNLAFTLVIALAYLATFTSSAKRFSSFDIALLLLLGLIYVTIGIGDFQVLKRFGTRVETWLYFLIEIPLGMLIQYLFGYTAVFWLILIPLSASVVMLLQGVWVWVMGLAIVAALVVPLHLYIGNWSTAVQNALGFAAAVLFVIVFTQVALREQKARAEVERLAAQLEEANQKLREYASQVEELATTKERNRLAREIHDSLGHYFTAVNMQLQASLALLPIDQGRAKTTIETAQRLSREGLGEVRRSVAALRASPTEGKTLPEALEPLLEECRSTGIISDFNLIGNYRPLPPRLETTLYRVGQEALTNVRKHSTASKVTLTLDYSQEKCVKLAVQDNGMGGKNTGGGFGLLGIRERVQLLGGMARITTAPEQGFTLEVEVPV